MTQSLVSSRSSKPWGFWSLKCILPNAAVRYPRSPSQLASVTAESGIGVLSRVTPTACGIRPVRNDCRLGVQSGQLANALLNQAPCLASSSSLGVALCGSPAIPIVSLAWSSPTRIRIFGGRCPRCRTG